MTPIVFPSQTPFRDRTPKSRAISVFVTVFLITMIIATAITFILPESFASTARVKLDTSISSTNAYDPYFIQTQFEVIQSQLVLNQVIQNLKLNEVWGKKYFAGETLSTNQTLEILKTRLSLAPVRTTSFIAITVYSDDRREATTVANAVAEAYQDYSAVKNNRVEIIDRAEPGKFPVKPNKPLNIALSAVAGIFLGALMAAIVGFFAARKK